MSSKSGVVAPSNSTNKDNLSSNLTPKADTEVKKKTARVSKKEPTKTKAKEHPAIDLDRQCGVIGTDGIPCPRVITCKAHTLAMKRVVIGRSRSFQELLLAHQANNSRVRAKTRKVEPGVSADSKSKLKSSSSLKGQGELSNQENLIEDSSDFDSEVELDLILNAIRSHASHPIATYEAPSLKRKYQMMRCQLLLNPSYVEDNVENVSKVDSGSEPETSFVLPPSTQD